MKKKLGVFLLMMIIVLTSVPVFAISNNYSAYDIKPQAEEDEAIYFTPQNPYRIQKPYGERFNKEEYVTFIRYGYRYGGTLNFTGESNCYNDYCLGNYTGVVWNLGKVY